MPVNRPLLWVGTEGLQTRIHAFIGVVLRIAIALVYTLRRPYLKGQFDVFSAPVVQARVIGAEPVKKLTADREQASRHCGRPVKHSECQRTDDCYGMTVGTNRFTGIVGDLQDIVSEN